MALSRILNLYPVILSFVVQKGDPPLERIGCYYGAST